ncbi:MAG: SDR family oxidoreductase, partial [Saprospiraceae bacterium]|nr:SDR family oxidoreductase [Saprospiraceae bacterium]
PIYWADRALGQPNKLGDHKVDAIIHAAGLDAASCAKDPALAHEVNVGLTQQLLKTAADARVFQFVFLSTVHVYGSPLAGILDEKMPFPQPNHPYAATKKAAEDEVLFYNENKLLQGTVLRLTNAFGCPASPKIERWELLVNDLCRQAVTTGRMVLRSSGRQLRDFITITDVCRAVEHVLEDRLGGVFNLGGEQVLSLRQMAELVADQAEAVLGFRPEITVNANEQEKDWPTFAVPIDRLKATGFSLLKNVAAEIEQTLLFCRENFTPNLSA